MTRTLTNPQPLLLTSLLVLSLVVLLTTAPVAAADKPDNDIVDTAIAAGTFETLVAAVQAAGLVDTLKGEGPFTVFAPTDEAFAKLPAGTVESLLEPENLEKLAAILTYHVLSGKVLSHDVADGASASTLQGGELAFAIEQGQVRVDSATVTAADIETSNGVIHVIDTVLLPK